MLTNAQKKQLKGLGMSLKLKYQVGKSGINDQLVDMLDKALEAHELIKIDVLKTVSSPLMEIALDLSVKLKAEIVQIIGRMILLFRQKKTNSTIKLTKI